MHKVTDCRVVSVSEPVARMLSVVQQVRSVLAVTAKNMAQWIYRHRRDYEITFGAKAQLSMEYLRLPIGFIRKFATRYVGPFEVLAAITPVSFRSKMPEAWHIHLVFPVS